MMHSVEESCIIFSNDMFRIYVDGREATNFKKSIKRLDLDEFDCRLGTNLFDMIYITTRVALADLL